MHTYLFYDTETTGLNPAFDQILHFAAIRTDVDLNELERHNLHIRLRPDVIISPGAIITHRISIERSRDGLFEFEAAKQLHSLLNEPGTISIGYNTLGFDDAFLRFTFYRNLLPPYTHQYEKKCRRMDLLPMTVLYWLYHRDGIRWPENNGVPTLKLEQLCAANRLADGRAHNAMVDVEATVALARKLKHNKAMWDYVSEYFIKQTDRQRIENLPIIFKSATEPHRLGVMTSSEFGFERNYQVPVLSIGCSSTYLNQTLWLRLDQPELKQATTENLAESTWVIRKRLGEPCIILPPLDRYWRRLCANQRSQALENIDWLRSQPEIHERVIAYHRDFKYPVIPNLDADAALYQIGFFSNELLSLCRKFHQCSFAEKNAMIRRFPIPEIQSLALRILGRNYPEQMTPETKRQFQIYLRHLQPLPGEAELLDYKGRPRVTPRVALQEIELMLEGAALDAEQREILKGLQTDLIHRFQ